MKRFSFLCLISLVAICLILPGVSLSQEKKYIKLKDPQMSGGMPLMEALKNRRSGREFSSKELPDQVLSNLIWAAFGINRPETGYRTAPSSMNRQDIDVYIATSFGVYVYEPKEHALIQVVPDDLRAMTGTQEYVKDAAVNLIFVSDFSKLGDDEDAWKFRTARIDTGLISQNVYLFCASEGLSTVVRGKVDMPPLAKAIKLRSDQHIIICQSVGYPK
ncbi:SagB/ThcOx family dehydrogenase [Candidatus Latescibacterota bacterium]